MVEKTELILICLVAVALLAIVARKIRVPYPILLTIGGVGLALVPGLPTIQLDPQLVFNLFLPPLLYPAAVYTSWRDFRGNLRSILPLAIVLVLLTMTATAYLFHGLVGLPLAVGFVFGAIISPPDAVAALAVTQTLRVARPPYFEWADATASPAGLGNGHVHSEWSAFHAHRSSTAAGGPGARSGYGDPRCPAGDRVCCGHRAGSFCLDVRGHLFAASPEPNVPP